MVASPAFSEPKHRLNCFQNKSEGQSKSYCFGSGLLENRYSSVFKDLARVRHVFHCIFSRFKTFLFFGHSKIKVRSCVLCVYAGTPLATLLSNFQRYICMVSVFTVIEADWKTVYILINCLLRRWLILIIIVLKQNISGFSRIRD